MEALNLNLKHDIQSQQRLFDILQSSSSSGGGGGPHHHGHGHSSSSSSIEFMLRSYDHQQDHDLIAAFNFNQYNNNTTNNHHHHHQQLPPPPQAPQTSPSQNYSSSVVNTTIPSSLSSSSSTSTTSPTTTTSPSTTSLSASEQHQHDMMTTTLELDPNIILQNYVNDNSDFGDGNISSNSGKGRPHYCTHCQASYKTRTHLRRHMVVHLPSRPYPCSDCGKGFNRKEHLSKHMEAVHSLTKHVCPLCEKQISRKDHLARHVKNMHPTYAVLLNKEDFLSLTSSATLAKIGVVSNRSKIAPTPSPTKSSSNPRSPTKASSLRIPIINSQSGGSISTTSPDGKKSLNQNQPNSSPPRDDNLNETRNRSASSSSSLTSSPHQGEAPLAVAVPKSESQGQVQSQNILQQTFHQLDSGPSLSSYSTTVATTTKTTTTTSSSPKPPKPPKRSLLQPNGNGLVSLTNLSLTLGGQIKEAPFANCSPSKKQQQQQQLNMILQCHECGVTCSTEKDLTTHLRGHKPQNFRCPDCPRAYTRREKLSEHIRCFHQGQKFKCEHCGKELSRKDHVLRHVRSIHPDLLASRFHGMNSTDIPVEHLGLPLPLVMNEDDHDRLSSIPMATTKQSHGGNGDGSSGAITIASSSANDMGVLLRSICQYCLKVFGTSYHLSRHIESCHNGDIRPYPCTSCSKQFKRKDHLTKHIKSHCPTLREGVLTPHRPRTSSGSSGCNIVKNGPEQHRHDQQLGFIPQKNAVRNPFHHHHENNKESSGSKRKVKSERIPSRKKLRVKPANPPSTYPSSPQNGPHLLMNLTNNKQESESSDHHNIKLSDEEDSSSQDFNLAMISSFISSSADDDGRDQEEDLSASLLLTQGEENMPTDQDQDEEQVVAVIVHQDDDHDQLVHPLASSPTSPISSSSLFRCGHCQKEFSSRDQLLDHLQHHSSDSSSNSSSLLSNDSQQRRHHHHHLDHRHHEGLRSIQFSNY